MAFGFQAVRTNRADGRHLQGFSKRRGVGQSRQSTRLYTEATQLAEGLEALARALDTMAVEMLEVALRRGYRDVAQLRRSRWFEPLGKDPRFEALLAKMNVPAQ